MVVTADAPATSVPLPPGGIRVVGLDAHAAVASLLQQHALEHAVVATQAGEAWCFALQPRWFAAWTSGFDTLNLAQTLGLATPHNGPDLARETLIAMLAAPVPFVFANAGELVSAVRMRGYIAQAASRTALAFDTEAAERPETEWTYDPDRGFLLREGCGLIEALVKATQPEVSGRLYSFSCYRATEYVLLLGIAMELRESNAELLAQLQHHCRHDVIRSTRFHDVFLHEYGSLAQPLPLRYYVPGDRLWFRNPDAHSADVTGFEGSWVVYMGAGLFSNFWKRDRPFTLTAKALEIHHWRHGVMRGPDGSLCMDETLVAERVAASLDDPAELAAILAQMVRLRDPKGVYASGGCLDATRECPRHVRPGTADIRLPPLA